MSRSSFLNSAAALIATFVLASPALADDAVKLAPTPMPAAGPTVAAAQEFCGEPIAKAAELIDRISARPDLKQVYKSDQYVAYSDDAKNSSVMYTFTVRGHPAYPAAVCRKPVQEGNNLVIKMSVVCDGEADACSKLRNDFNVLTAQMQAEVDQKIAASKK